MPYPSVDRLQQTLAQNVFHYAKDKKKASGRALGTLVEIITFYALKSWGLERNVAIERPLPEFANAEITHNVEYSLHPTTHRVKIAFSQGDLPLTAKKIARAARLKNIDVQDRFLKSTALLTNELVLRNSCVISDSGDEFLNAYLDDFSGTSGHYTIASLRRHPFAIFECKRVGVEEGMKKGPQTIEKAKQGAYVARAVSALQKIRLHDGKMGGFIQKRDGSTRYQEYYSLLAEIIASEDRELLRDFIMTVGVVSNHGNWFTSESPNKEMKVLAQSYDWLLFLTDAGIARFIDELLLNPKKGMKAAKTAFLASYTGQKGVNQFTKVQMDLTADAALQEYFRGHEKIVESWFNIVTPAGKQLGVLKKELDTLKNKNWQEIVL